MCMVNSYNKQEMFSQLQAQRVTYSVTETNSIQYLFWEIELKIYV